MPKELDVRELMSSKTKKELVELADLEGATYDAASNKRKIAIEILEGRELAEKLILEGDPEASLPVGIIHTNPGPGEAEYIDLPVGTEIDEPEVTAKPEAEIETDVAPVEPVEEPVEQERRLSFRDFDVPVVDAMLGRERPEPAEEPVPVTVIALDSSKSDEDLKEEIGTIVTDVIGNVTSVDIAPEVVKAMAEGLLEDAGPRPEPIEEPEVEVAPKELTPEERAQEEKAQALYIAEDTVRYTSAAFLAAGAKDGPERKARRDAKAKLYALLA